MTAAKDRPSHRGASLTEVLAVMGALALGWAALAPALAGARGRSPAEQSLANLRTLHQALVCYAADFNDRQFTAAPDDLGVVGGNCNAYGSEFGCHPALIAGWGCDGLLYRYSGSCPGMDGLGSHCSGHEWAYRPMGFSGLTLGIGSFLLVNQRPLHDYLGGRMYDPVFYSELVVKPWTAAEPLFAIDCEFVENSPAGGHPIPSTYVFSPAAMYHPDVMRPVAAGGFQNPDSFDDGYRSPSVSQARYPHLKSWMIEHHWLVNPPGACNPAYLDPFGGYSPKCDPYLFNHGLAAQPGTLYFDGSVERVSNLGVFVDDARVLRQTGGVDGLWSRDTPMGASGYFGDAAFDGIALSHHVLTTGGIRGRDRITLPPGTGAFDPNQ